MKRTMNSRIDVSILFNQSERIEDESFADEVAADDAFMKSNEEQ
jgi:hypothetical protein